MRIWTGSATETRKYSLVCGLVCRAYRTKRRQQQSEDSYGWITIRQSEGMRRRNVHGIHSKTKRAT
ncbi:hypothetical protein L226DRAFT_162654 [Lentinus tigrinus ALCF2SS1-7]|uniref:uncharacterized protein n=1 Tax=Lentinus tigrinus ALCF2SS1-7 TaxID=1328758 RepID=UPI001165E265|nr:hypothetical protein L226DRAFT_162654 [Lentinus tigrinus ALCF2SS1-7]